ncbi:GntR family transcriptional regulator [Streptomyces odontomachi]|uniref:GntR family transcriptional regulator n=1 Tax=Streptomyces odontomachi TaxID=2944940 RepID=UPI0021095E62|nr:GntR family transcriptional regulator [Streptomyces sp. ODS25]
MSEHDEEVGVSDASTGGLSIDIAPTHRIADSVFQGLREAVLDGRIPPGRRLSVPALAQQLDVSRSPVREAVARLTADGLAVESPRRGAVVATITLADLAELYEVRGALEGVVARLAIERSGPELADRLDEVLAEHQAALDAGDIQTVQRCDAAFHRLIRQASRHDYASRLLDQIQSQVRLAMRTTMVAAGPERALREHREIATAIRLGDAELAERRAQAHVARLRDALRAQS